jgi:hypothetical protein
VHAATAPVVEGKQLLLQQQQDLQVWKTGMKTGRRNNQAFSLVQMI